MDALLSFFSDLILLTAGLVVALFWVILIIVGAVELWDAVFGDNTDLDKDDV